jgi:hypothetical protein
MGCGGDKYYRKRQIPMHPLRLGLFCLAQQDLRRDIFIRFGENSGGVSTSKPSTKMVSGNSMLT